MSEKDKVCFLLWDEVSLQPHLHFADNDDKIMGFEDWGNARSNWFDDHALIFMLRGINRNWKIPVSYNFCKACTNAAQLMRRIKELIRAIKASGFKVVATVCDQGQTNAACISKLLEQGRPRVCSHEQPRVALRSWRHGVRPKSERSSWWGNL